jgi:hypothetical protein
MRQRLMLEVWCWCFEVESRFARLVDGQLPQEKNVDALPARL